MKTLVEYAKGLETSNPDRPLIESFASESDVAAAIPWLGLGEGSPIFEGFRQAVLPTIGFRAINEGSTTGTGKVTPFQEPTYIIDHDLDVDRAIVDRYGPVRRAREETMAAASAGRLLVDTIMKGDTTANPRVFDGLQRRSRNFGRLITNNAASGGGPLSLLQLDRAIANTNKPTHIIADFQMMPLLMQAARTSALTGFVIQTWDGIGKPTMTYGGLPILWGYQKDEQGALLPFTEVATGGGGAVTSSLYVVSFREGGLHGLELKPLTFKEMGQGGLLQDGITYRTHMSWDIGLVDEHKYCFTRLSSITNATIVA